MFRGVPTKAAPRPTNKHTVNIHDREEFNNRLFDACRLEVLRSTPNEPSALLAIQNNTAAMQGRALECALRKYRKHCGNTSKYTPHCGEQEKARRRPYYYDDTRV